MLMNEAEFIVIYVRIAWVIHVRIAWVKGSEGSGDRASQDVGMNQSAVERSDLRIRWDYRIRCCGSAPCGSFYLIARLQHAASQVSNGAEAGPDPQQFCCKEPAGSCRQCRHSERGCQEAGMRV